MTTLIKQVRVIKLAVTQKLPANVDQLADKYAQQYNVDGNLVKAIIQHESGGNNIKSPDSTATGLMQLTHDTAASLGVTDPTNPDQNVRGGTQLFSQLLQQYKDPKLALAAYYAGPTSIKDGKIVTTTIQTAKGPVTIDAKDTTKYANDISTLAGLTSGNTDEKTGAIKRPDVSQFVKDNPTFPSAVQKFMGAYSALPSDQAGLIGNALAALRAKGDETDSGLMAKYLTQGDTNAIKTHDDNVILTNAQHKLDMQTQEIEARAQFKEQQDEAASQKKQSMLNTLEDAEVPKGILDMNPKDAVTTLQNEGVTLSPQGIRDALTIANYDAPLSTAASRLWFKDLNLTQQDMLDIVKTFNPDYNESAYTNLKKYTDPNSTVGKTLFAASAVANHLQDLQNVAHEVQTNGEGTGQFPILNRLENAYNYHAGGDSYSQLAGLTNAINGEMAKVLSGGFAPDKQEVDALLKNMTPENSLQQIDALTRLYTNVMYGKVKPFDEEYSQMKNGKHMVNIPSSLTQQFQHYGLTTPWAQPEARSNQPNQPNQPNPNEKPVTVNGQIIGYTVDGKTISRMALTAPPAQ